MQRKSATPCACPRAYITRRRLEQRPAGSPWPLRNAAPVAFALDRRWPVLERDQLLPLLPDHSDSAKPSSSPRDNSPPALVAAAALTTTTAPLRLVSSVGSPSARACYERSDHPDGLAAQAAPRCSLRHHPSTAAFARSSYADAQHHLSSCTLHHRPFPPSLAPPGLHLILRRTLSHLSSLTDTCAPSFLPTPLSPPSAPPCAAIPLASPPRHRRLSTHPTSATTSPL